MNTVGKMEKIWNDSSLKDISIATRDHFTKKLIYRIINNVTLYILIALDVYLKIKRSIFIYIKDQCDITKGDCVADNEKEENNCNKSTCFRKPDSCKDYGDVDLFGKNQIYQCHCKHLSDCQFRNFTKCKNGCLPGYKKPYCQKRCPPQLYGKDCINECHCSRAESCHQSTGICNYGCEDGWYGEKCDMQTYVNIARGQTTNQTSIYGIKGTTVFHNGTCEKMNISMASDKAVDGNFDPGFTHKSCANTDWEKDPYWEVMFDKPYTIYQLRIYNRMGIYRKYC
ncbi:multiple epidermal growth factor-like domains protein 10 [Octopus sinensis]|uniref:Multiple epidermal growth factor-like domains protein 10 n=1 Tax=Octopus sinensis TaxID=2607531 RepID=A0A7E6EKP1_9MOLL|nr:multiple epidermal growth factor-like domains protein 10 [Octopus sinensis]